MLTPDRLNAIRPPDAADMMLWDQRVTVKNWTGETMATVMLMTETEFNLHLTRAVAFAKGLQLAQMQAQRQMQAAAENQRIIAELNGKASGGLQIVRNGQR